ncbi:MAG: toll/interleukin-1 receptor domain-containing protein [Pseudonocardiaceae bacterium]
MIRHVKSFDFFISYAGPDIAYAETLADTLQPVGRIFIAPQSELLGEDWPNPLTTAIRDTWVTVAIISRHTPAAHFQEGGNTTCPGRGPGRLPHRDTDPSRVARENATTSYRTQITKLSRPSFGIARRDRLGHR